MSSLAGEPVLLRGCVTLPSPSVRLTFLSSPQLLPFPPFMSVPEPEIGVRYPVSIGSSFSQDLPGPATFHTLHCTSASQLASIRTINMHSR